jgi:hypothetical protein
MAAMQDRTVITATAGGYPLRHRAGVGHPLLVVTPFGIAASEAWLKPRRTGMRPVAIMGAADLERFLSPAETVVRDILGATGWAHAPGIQVAGYSSGGFAAMLFGAILALDLPSCRVEVVVFSPPVCLWPTESRARTIRHRTMLARSVAEATSRTHLERYGDTRPWLRRAAAVAGDRFSVKVVYPEANGEDRQQAELLSGIAGVTLLPMPTAQHSLHKFLVARGSADVARDLLESHLSMRRGKTAACARAEAMALHAAFDAALAAHADLRAVVRPAGMPVE